MEAALTSGGVFGYEEREEGEVAREVEDSRVGQRLEEGEGSMGWTRRVWSVSMERAGGCGGDIESVYGGTGQGDALSSDDGQSRRANIHGNRRQFAGSRGTKLSRPAASFPARPALPCVPDPLDRPDAPTTSHDALTFPIRAHDR